MGSIVAHLFLSVIDRCCLNNNCQITSRTDRNGMTNNFIAQDFLILFFQSQTIILTLTIPLFQFDDQADALTFFNTLNTIQCLNINDTDTSQLNKISCDIRRCTNQLIIVGFFDLNHIIGYKAVSSLNQFQSRLTLTDTAFAGDQDAFTEYIHKYTMDGDSRCQFYLQETVQF